MIKHALEWFEQPAYQFIETQIVILKSYKANIFLQSISLHHAIPCPVPTKRGILEGFKRDCVICIFHDVINRDRYA